jgi:hypothetical protein
MRDAIPALWLRVYVDLKAQIRPGKNAGKSAFPDCIIDTGSHLSVLPEYIWSRFKPGVIRPLQFDPAMPQSLRTVTLGGGSYPYDLGELTIRLRDLVGNVIDVSVIAQITRDGGRLTIPMLLGLRGGALDSRILRAEPDATAPFGQAWMLEEP